MQFLPAFLFVFGGSVVALLSALVGTIVILHFAHKRTTRQRTPLAVHILAMFAAGVLGWFIGTGWGISHFCFVPGVGAQCGLGGVLITGPIAFGIGALAYAAAYAIWDIELP